MAGSAAEGSAKESGTTIPRCKGNADMKESTRRKKAAEAARIDSYINKLLIALSHPVTAAIVGVCAVNVLAKIKDQNGNPLLFSEAIRLSLQTAAFTYPVYAGGTMSTEQKLLGAGLVAGTGLMAGAGELMEPEPGTEAPGAFKGGDPRHWGWWSGL